MGSNKISRAWNPSQEVEQAEETAILLEVILQKVDDANI